MDGEVLRADTERTGTVSIHVKRDGVTPKGSRVEARAAFISEDLGTVGTPYSNRGFRSDLLDIEVNLDFLCGSGVVVRQGSGNYHHLNSRNESFDRIHVVGSRG